MDSDGQCQQSPHQLAQWWQHGKHAYSWRSCFWPIWEASVLCTLWLVSWGKTLIFCPVSFSTILPQSLHICNFYVCKQTWDSKVSLQISHFFWKSEDGGNFLCMYVAWTSLQACIWTKSLCGGIRSNCHPSYPQGECIWIWQGVFQAVRFAYPIPTISFQGRRAIRTCGG